MRIFLSVFALTALVLSGCGPMGSGPMPPRLDADSQKQIDDGWEKALNPPDQLDRQALLDAMVVTQAYQAGVDRLSFHSEKKYSGGTVIMEIQFDRAKPAEDRFEVRVVAKDGRVLRQLTYNRTEVETTYQDLTGEGKRAVLDANGQPLSSEERKKKEEQAKKRIDAVTQFFPKRDGEEPARK